MDKLSGPKVSVILPVYNVEGYIERCIESLQAQTLKSLEFIFIDDCSTDTSMKAAEAWAAKDSRVRIIRNEKNSGIGSSSNRGIALAQGEYLSFVDADDYVAKDFYELLYRAAHDRSLDIVKGSVVRETLSGKEIDSSRGPNKQMEKCLADGTPLYRYFSYERQGALYRRDWIRRNGIEFGLSARAQDATFLLRACYRVESFDVCDEACYFFCERTSSVMHSLDAAMLDGFADSVHDQVVFVRDNLDINKDTISYLSSRFSGALVEYVRYDDEFFEKTLLNKYLSAIRRDLLSLPCCDDLTKGSYPLYVLKTYGIGLAPRPYFSPWEAINPPIRYARLVQRWVDFCIEHPQEHDACRKSLRTIFTAAIRAVRGQPQTDYSLRERMHGALILAKQALRLLPYWR